MSTPGTETILLQVDVQANTARLVELQKALNDAKAANATLNQSFKDGQLSADEYAAGQVRLKQQTAAITQEVKVLTTANAQQDVANKAAVGSTEQLRAQYGLAVGQLNKLTSEERDNTVAGQKLQAQTKALNDELLKQEKAYGNSKRAVGDYNAGIKDVNVVSGQLTGGLRAAIDKGLAPFQNELDRGSGLLGKFKSGSDLVKQGLGLLKGAGEEGALGFKAVAGGIALTGIGLFVLAISAVVTYFTQTAEGGRVLAGVLGGLGAVLQVATDTVASFGKTLAEAVKNPRQALTELVQILEDQVVNRFKAFGVIFNAIRNSDTKQLANGFLQLGSGVEDVTGKAGRLFDKTKAAYELASRFAGREKDLAKQRRDLEREDIVAESRVAVLLRLSKERGKTASDQLASLKEAGSIENELSANRIKQSEKELALVNDRIKAAGAGKKAELIADKQAKEVEILQAESQQKETNARIQVRESVFLEKQRTEAATAAQQRREDAIKAKQTEVEQALLTVQAGSAAELALKQRGVQLAADLEIAGAKKTAAEKALIQSKADVESQKLAEDFTKKQAEEAKKRTDAANKEVIREYNEAKQHLEDYIANKEDAAKKDYAQGLIGENQYQKQLNALEKARLAAELVNATDYGQATAKIIKAQGENEIKEAKRVKDEKQKIKAIENEITNAARDAALIASDAIIEAFGKESEAGRAALVVKKVLALADIGISLEKQLQSNAEAGRNIAKDIPAPLGPILGTAYIIAEDALTIASNGAAAAKILGFNTGGLVPGAGNTDTVPALLTPGESVMNKQATQQFAPVLSYLNSLAGGTNFAPGFTPGRQPARQIDGGLAARNAGATAFPSAAEIGAAVARNVPTSIAVDEINRGQGRKANARAITSLG